MMQKLTIKEVARPILKFLDEERYRGTAEALRSTLAALPQDDKKLTTMRSLRDPKSSDR